MLENQGKKDIKRCTGLDGLISLTKWYARMPLGSLHPKRKVGSSFLNLIPSLNSYSGKYSSNTVKYPNY